MDASSKQRPSNYQTNHLSRRSFMNAIAVTSVAAQTTPACKAAVTPAYRAAVIGHTARESRWEVAPLQRNGAVYKGR